MNLSSLLKKAVFLSLLLTSCFAFGQSTGSFDVNINFQGQPRKLSFYVPPNYNPANSYRLMVCLHGLGDTSASYRDALINFLGWGANIPNTIFVCPEAADPYADYFDPPGGEAIIQESMDYAIQNYNIDTNNIVLQGFSLGGRAALRYGLDNYSRFKGLLLNTPAVQGVKEAMNRSSFYPFNYANASRIPIYITLGNSDIAYLSPVDSAFEQMVLADGIVKYVQFPGGHTVQPVAQLVDFIPFFDNPSRPGLDLDMVKINTPFRSCSAQIQGADLLVRNTGEDTIRNINLDYTVNGNTQTHTWTGTLAPFRHALITLPAMNAAAGNQSLQATVTTLNNNMPDTVTGNNSRTVSVPVETQGLLLPFFEGFEGNAFPPAGWVRKPAGEFYSPWEWDNTVKKTGNQSMGAFNTIFIFDNSGQKEDISTPLLDLSSLASPFLSFDVSYNYHLYVPPVALDTMVFADTLEVLISTDCGNTYDLLYKKGGADLATFFKPIVNPLDLDSLFVYPADTNWRTEQIDLSNYAAADKAFITFRYTSALGGSVNMDNIRVTNALGVPATVQNVALEVFPNPARDLIHITADKESIERVEVLDASGKTAGSFSFQSRNGKVTIPVSSLPDGFYVLRVYTEKGAGSTPVMIRK